MEEIVFKVGVNTGNAAKDIDNVEQGLKDADKATQNVSKAAKTLDKDLYNVNAKFEDIYGDLQPLSSRLGEIEDRMYELALAGKQNTEEFQTLQAEVVKYRQTIIETDRAVDLLAEQGKVLGTALQIGNAVVAGYGAVQGAAALVGEENEDLQKTMVKLQAVQAVLNSLEQIKITLDQRSVILMNLKNGLTKAATVAQVAYTAAVGGTTGAMKVLRVAMLALPIVAIIAGIMALIGAISWLISSNEEAEEVNNRLTASYERQSEALDRAGKQRARQAENELKLAKARGAGVEEVHNLEMNLLKEQEVQRRKSLKLEADMLTQKKQAYKLALDEENYELAKTIREEIEQHRKKYKDLKDMDGQFRVDAAVRQAEFDKERRAKEAEAQKKEQEDAKKAEEEKAKKAKEYAEKRRQQQAAEAQKALELQRTLEDLYIANIEDTGAREIAALALTQQRRREELIKQFGENTELLKQLDLQQATERQALLDKQAKDAETKANEESKKALERSNFDAKSRLEAELMQMQDDFDARMALEQELALMERDIALQNKELTDGEKLKIEAEYQAKLKGIKDQEVENEKQRTAAIQESRQALLSAVAGAIGQMAGLAREGSKTQKALALTELAINTGIGFVNGLRIAQQSAAATGPGAAFAFPIFYAQQIGAVLSAAKRAKEIMKAGVDVQPPSIGGAAGAAGAASAPTPPQLAEGTSTLTAGLPGSGMAQKVYVVEHDITMQQQQSQKVDALSTYGG